MGSTPSSAAATRDSWPRRPKYTSCVIDTREWPSWSAIMRAVAPASSSTVAVVFRHAWKVIHSSKPCRSRASTSHRVTVRGSRNVPSTVPNTGSSAPTPTARRLSSKITHHSRSCKIRWTVEDPGSLRSLVGSVLGSAQAYDRQHESELVRTVQTCLERERQAGPAAAALHIHPNTLAYRLRRFEEVSGRN